VAKTIRFDDAARRSIMAGANPMALKRGFEAALAALVGQLAEASIAVDSRAQIAQVATISANDDPEIGELVAEAIDRVGPDGVVTVEESNTFGLELAFTEGLRFDKGYISPYFVTDADRQEAVLDDPYLLIVPANGAGGGPAAPAAVGADPLRRHRSLVGGAAGGEGQRGPRLRLRRPARRQQRRRPGHLVLGPGWGLRRARPGADAVDPLRRRAAPPRPGQPLAAPRVALPPGCPRLRRVAAAGRAR
jgi:hypothetical protein